MNTDDPHLKCHLMSQIILHIYPHHHVIMLKLRCRQSCHNANENFAKLLRNIAKKSVITNSKQLKPKKSADSYKDNYGDRNWNFVKLINKVLQSGKNYGNFRVLPSIQLREENSLRIRTLFWDSQAEYRNVNCTTRFRRKTSHSKIKTYDEFYCEDAIVRVVFNFSEPGEEILRKTRSWEIRCHVAVQDDPEVYHEIKTLNTDNDTIRERIEEHMDFNIPGLPHSVVKHAQSTNVRQLIQKIENHPNRHALQRDLR